MRTVALAFLTTLLGVTGAFAGEPAKGKICDFDPRAFGIPDRGVTESGHNCATSEYAEKNTDWSMGGDTGDFSASKVRIEAVGGPPYILPGCRAGREMQVLIFRPGHEDRGNWVFPRFLRCP
jgi:hypothetical protein